MGKSLQELLEEEEEEEFYKNFNKKYKKVNTIEEYQKNYCYPGQKAPRDYLIKKKRKYIKKNKKKLDN